MQSYKLQSFVVLFTFKIQIIAHKSVFCADVVKLFAMTPVFVSSLLENNQK